MNQTSLTTTKPGQATQIKRSALELMANRLNIDAGKLLLSLKAVAFKDSRSDEELTALVIVANEYQLNPFLRQIWAFPAKGGGITPIISVDGWIQMVNARQEFDGVKFDFAYSEDGKLFSCTCHLKIKGREDRISIEEFFDECVRNTDPWKQMPRRMLRHKAFIQCARIAFGFGGVHDEDEGNDIRGTVDIQVEPERSRTREIRPAKGSPESDFAPVSVNFHNEMETLLEENGLTFTMLQMWGDQSGSIEDATRFGSLQEIPSEVLERLLKSRKKMIESLKVVKEGMAR